MTTTMNNIRGNLTNISTERASLLLYCIGLQMLSVGFSFLGLKLRSSWTNIFVTTGVLVRSLCEPLIFIIKVLEYQLMFDLKLLINCIF